MGRNNRDYKIKDKNLTKNKKNAKLNKSIALTLAGMAAIGAGAALGGQNQNAQAMMGRVGSMASKMVKGTMTKMPTTSGKISSSVKVGTSRVLNGAPGAINSGRVGSNGTPYAGIPGSAQTKTVNLTGKVTPSSIKNQSSSLTTNTNTNTSGPKTHTSTLSVTLNSTTNTSTTTGTKTSTTNTSSTSGTLTSNTSSSTTTASTTGANGTHKSSNIGSLGNKLDPFKNGNAVSLTLKDGAHKQQAYSQKGNTGGTVFTTEGHTRK